MLYREDRGWGFSQPTRAEKDQKASTEYQIAALNQRVALLEQLIVSQYSATQYFQTEQENRVYGVSGESQTSSEKESQGDK